MRKHTLDGLRVYQKAQEISDLVWEIVKLLPGKENHPTGNQILRCSDSISANIAEGYGRYTFKDRAHYFIVARGSLNETENWRRLLKKRYSVPDSINIPLEKLLKEELYLINKYIKYLRSKQYQ